MSNVIGELSDYIDKLSSLKRYIEQLENKKQVEYILETYQLDTDNIEPLTYLYRPKILFEKQTKCGKCNNNYLIGQTNTVTNNYKICDCFKDVPSFGVEVLKVSHIECMNTDKQYYCFYYNGKHCYVSVNEVLDGFCVDDMYTNYKLLYYKDFDSCHSYCKARNEGN